VLPLKGKLVSFDDSTSSTTADFLFLEICIYTIAQSRSCQHSIGALVLFTRRSRFMPFPLAPWIVQSSFTTRPHEAICVFRIITQRPDIPMAVLIPVTPMLSIVVDFHITPMMITCFHLIVIDVKSFITISTPRICWSLHLLLCFPFPAGGFRNANYDR
jgi:hypothetical protein